MIEARGTFHKGLTSIDLGFDVEARLKDGKSAKIIAVKENLCEWANLEQQGRSNCPPQHGAAKISAGLDLARGWVMEVSFFFLGRLRKTFVSDFLMWEYS